MSFNVTQYELTRSAAKSFVTSIASGGNNTTLVDATQHLDADLYKDQVIEIISASNNAKYMSKITSHTDTTFTFDALDDGYQVAIGDLYHVFSLDSGVDINDIKNIGCPANWIEISGDTIGNFTSIYCGGLAGNIRVDTAGGQTSITIPVSGGGFVIVGQFTKIYASGTTATSLFGLY